MGRRMKGISDTPQAETSRRVSSGFRLPRANPIEPSQSFIRTTQKNAPSWVRLRGADEGTRTHMVSHRNLKPARLPVSPHPHLYNGLAAHYIFSFVSLPLSSTVSQYALPPDVILPTTSPFSMTIAALSSIAKARW